MTARNHHYVPQCYLKRFTQSRNKEGKLFVFDGENKKSFQTKPRNVGSKRDFNRIDNDKLGPNFIEEEYAALETHFDNALSQICSERNFDDENSRKYMFALIAQLISRNPRMRATFNEFRTQIFKRVVNLTLSSKETYEAQIKSATSAGHFESEPTATYEEMKDFMERGEYDLAFSRTSHIQHEVNLMESLQGIIAERNWCLIISSGDPFITCDHPAVLISTRAERSAYGIGLGLRNTELYIPISPELGLVGSFEELPKLGNGDLFQVSWRNAQVITFARPQVYSSTQEFTYMWPGPLQPFKTGRDLLDDDRFVRRETSSRQTDHKLF